MKYYNTLSDYWKKIFNTRVQKIPLDAGFDCPNRDGTLSRNGCIFCNPSGSGTGLYAGGMGLKEQYLYLRDKYLARHKNLVFAAYLQSYSNTYGPKSQLELTLQQLEFLPGVEVLCVGTRPDCLDREKISILAEFPAREIWLELGLQSCSRDTLKLINRGHTPLDFEYACGLAREQGLKVCAHIIAGLPGENLQIFLNTIDFVNRLPVQGIKLHNLYVCKNTPLARWWMQGHYTPLGREEYVQWAVAALTSLRPDIVIHRITGDPAVNELLAPAWSKNKSATINDIQETMHIKNLSQGMNFNTIDP
ncbi:TIGR01212 family radical SAM protein [Desulfonatronospira sp.]|uniref:TIGR01212 family radical SAM protein n=1 Tax=Desulfonatronospira sp. TaxID=1962951 RepID=UPI0025C5393C|nr:TIGR01212 family radical SAM protein [Desulfonatronospira sp.]